MRGTIVLIFAILGLSYVEATGVSQCPQHPGVLPVSYQIEGCAVPPCSLPQLEDAVLNFQFIATRSIQSIRTTATAHFGFIPIPLHLGEYTDSCKHLTNAECPLNEGDIANFTLRAYVEPFFPVGVSASMEFRAVDQKNDVVFCLRVPIRIVEPRNIV